MSAAASRSRHAAPRTYSPATIHQTVQLQICSDTRVYLAAKGKVSDGSRICILRNEQNSAGGPGGMAKGWSEPQGREANRLTQHGAAQRIRRLENCRFEAGSLERPTA
jgi:hypothetical protein